MLQYEYVIWDIELRRITNMKYVAPVAELVSLEMTAVIMTSVTEEEEEVYCEDDFPGF